MIQMYLANNVGTSAVTFDNVVSGENVTVDYKYTYNDTSVAGDTSNITINNLVLKQHKHMLTITIH